MSKKKRQRGTGQIFQVGRVWKIRYTVNGRRVQEGAGPRHRDAVQLLATRLGQRSEGRLHPDAAKMRWAEVDVIILDEHKLHRSYEKVERHVRRHLRRHFAGERVTAINYGRLLAYKQERLAEGASPSTVRYELSLVRTGLMIAHKAGRLVQLPPMPSVHVENTRTGFFEPHQFETLCQHLPEKVRAVVTFMYWTGWRRNEVLSREWRHVDFATGEIRLEPGETKNGKGRVLPFDAVPALRALLESQREYTDQVQRRTGQIVPWLFHREGKRVKSIRQAWRTACLKAGLWEWALDEDGNQLLDRGKPVRRASKIPHDFRRTAVRNLVRAGVSEKVAMAVTGHLTRSVFARYEIVNSGDVRDGLARMVQAQEAAQEAAKGPQDAAKGTVKAHPSPETSKTPRKPEGLAMENRGSVPRVIRRRNSPLRPCPTEQPTGNT